MITPVRCVLWFYTADIKKIICLSTKVFYVNSWVNNWKYAAISDDSISIEPMRWLSFAKTRCGCLSLSHYLKWTHFAQLDLEALKFFFASSVRYCSFYRRGHLALFATAVDDLQRTLIEQCAPFSSAAAASSGSSLAGVPYWSVTMPGTAASQMTVTRNSPTPTIVCARHATPFSHFCRKIFSSSSSGLPTFISFVWPSCSYLREPRSARSQVFFLCFLWSQQLEWSKATKITFVTSPTERWVSEKRTPFKTDGSLTLIEAEPKIWIKS